jgi:hypothetical protein
LICWKCYESESPDEIGREQEANDESRCEDRNCHQGSRYAKGRVPAIGS